jgi:carbamoyl-phosphate synthase large subunit
LKQSGSWEEVVHASVVGSTDLDVDRIGTPVMVKGAFYKAYEAHTSKEALSHYLSH